MTNTLGATMVFLYALFVRPARVAGASSNSRCRYDYVAAGTFHSRCRRSLPVDATARRVLNSFGATLRRRLRTAHARAATRAT